jgi:hypothetical protein
VSELERLLEAKYTNVIDGIKILGGAEIARNLFLKFQSNLYLPRETYAIS